MNLRKPESTALKTLHPLTKKNSLCHLGVGSNILKTLKTNLDLNKMRIEMSKKENSFCISNQISDRISVSSKLDTIDTIESDRCHPHIPIPKPNNNHKANKGLLVYENYDKSQMDELTAIQNAINGLISNIDSNFEAVTVQSQCDELWRVLASSAITQEEDVLMSMKSTIQSLWHLLFFSIIICYDIMNNNNNNDNNHIEHNEKYLIQIKNSFEFHSKLIKILKQHYPPFPLTPSDIAKAIQSMQCLLTSIASIHKSFFSIYPNDKHKEFFSLWSKIPQLPFDLLTLLYNKVKLSKDITPRQIQIQSHSQSQNGHNAQQSSKVPLLSKQKDKEYTLVLDLDETLIYYEEDLNDINKGKVHYRPGLFAFLENVAPYYELILYTMSMKTYADSIVNLIEKDRVFFQKRLYRENSSFHKNQRIKDLNALGRDLKKTIIIDDNESNVILQKDNAILIKPYYGKDDNDMTLINLIPNLVKIAKEKMDIRVGLKMVKDAIILPTKAKGNLNGKQRRD